MPVTVTVPSTGGVGGGANTDGSNLTNTANWRSVLAVPSLTQAHTRGLPCNSGVAFDGATNSTRILSTLTGVSIGTEDFSFWARFLCPTTLPAVNTPAVMCLAASSTASGSSSFGLRFMTPYSLNVTFRDVAGTGVAKNAEITNFVTTYGGQLVDIVVTRSGSTLKIYVNGVDTSYTTTGSGAWSDTVTSSYLMIGSFDYQDTFTSTIFRAAVFNRALSAAQAAVLPGSGIEFADIGANFTALTSGTLVAGKRYRIVTFVAGDNFTNVGAGSNATGVEFVATGTTPTTWSNGSTLRRIGAFVDPALDLGVGLFFPDRSGNFFYGEGTTAIEHSQPVNGGLMCVSKQFLHTEISATTGTTKLFDMPANAGLIRVEIYRTAAMDAGITVAIGSVGNASLFIASMAMSSTGFVSASSSGTNAQSNTGYFGVYIKKSGATTTGSCIVRAIYEIRN